MKPTKEAIWKLIVGVAERMHEQSDYIVLYSDSEKLFYQNFDFYYAQIEENFMSPDLKKHRLDRHKVASIIICSVLKTKVIGVGQEHISKYENKEFLGNEKIAFEVALSYMYDALKKNFDEGSVPYERLFDNYVLPAPYSCDRQYGEVICRDLMFSNTLYDLSPLLLSNLLFFIEEYSFNVSGIQRIEK